MKTNLKLTAVFEPCDEGGFLAYVEEIAGINTQGETLDEAKVNLQDAMELFFLSKREESNRNIQNKNVIKENLEFA